MERGPSRRGNAAVVFHERPDEVLLAEFVNTHDERIFSEFVQRHERMVLCECWRVLHHRQDAEDASQRTFFLLLRKAALIRKGSSLKSWLHGVAYRVAKNMRKSKRRREKHESPQDDGAQLAQLRQETGSYETVELINIIVECLPLKYCVPFLAHCLEGKSKKEVAQELDLPEGTVASCVRRARELLRRRLGQRGVIPRSK